MAQYVEIVSKTGREAEVLEVMVPHYIAVGWTRKGKAPAKKKQPKYTEEVKAVVAPTEEN